MIIIKTLPEILSHLILIIVKNSKIINTKVIIFVEKTRILLFSSFLEQNIISRITEIIIYDLNTININT